LGRILTFQKRAAEIFKKSQAPDKTKQKAEVLDGKVQQRANPKTIDEEVGI
jgi:hypothetical protein